MREGHGTGIMGRFVGRPALNLSPAQLSVGFRSRPKRATPGESSGYQMNGRHTHDANGTPPAGSRRGYNIREKSQLDATFIGTVLGGDPAESLIEELKEDQGAEEEAERHRFERERDRIDDGIRRNKAEVDRVTASVARRDERKEALLKRLEAIEEDLKATEIAIAEKSGEILKARSQHPFLAIQRRREQEEALDELRKQRYPERDRQERDERRLAREHEERLSRALRGSIFTRPVAILLMSIGLVGLLVLGWWTGERIRTVVDTARLAGALDTLATVTTSLLDGGIVWRALVALAVVLLLAVAVKAVRKDFGGRILAARRSRRSEGPLPDDPAPAGGARHVPIGLGFIALPLLAMATIGLLLGGTDVGPMLSTFVGAGAFTFAGMAFCAVIAGATAFWVAAEMEVRDGESSRSRVIPRPFRWVLSVCFAVVVLLEGIRMVRMEAYELFTFDHAFLPILLTPLVSACLLWGAICLGRHHELRRAQAEVKRLNEVIQPMSEAQTAGPGDGIAGTRTGGRWWSRVAAIFSGDWQRAKAREPYITRDDLVFSPELVAEHGCLSVKQQLQNEQRDQVRRELETIETKRLEARESLGKLHEDRDKLKQQRDQVEYEHRQTLMRRRHLYREQHGNLNLARLMGKRARSSPDGKSLRNALASLQSDANGETGI